MLQEERLHKIAEFIKKNGSAEFSNLAGMLNVSEGTVRKDLAELDRRKIVKLVRGGAVWANNNLARGGSDARLTINQQEKKELVQGLGSIIENGSAIAMNGGTTNIEAAKYLVKNYNRLTVITNNLSVVDIMKARKDFRVILTGGIYCPEENTIVGKQAEKDVALYNTDVAVLAVNGISLEKGITDFRFEESGVINAMIRNANKSVVIADHSKFDRISCINICSLDKISCVITDSEIDTQVKNKYNAADVNIITSNKN